MGKDQLLDELAPLLEASSQIHHHAFGLFAPEVERLCRIPGTEEEVSHCLDSLLSFACDDSVLVLFKKLCRQYLPTYPETIGSYIDAYTEMWDEKGDVRDMEHDVISILRSYNKFAEDDLQRFDVALGFATEAHAGAFRKGTTIPYIVHPIEASLIACQLADDIDTVIGAVLHDVVEDTQYTLDDIRQRFGDKIASLVADESEDKRPDLPAEETWRIRKQETLDHLAHASREAKIIAFADKLSNLRAIASDYAAIGDELWQRFNSHNPEDHLWYYGSIGQLTIEFSSSPLWREYNKLLDDVFRPKNRGEYQGHE